VQVNKGGNPEIVKESQRKRGASVELVDQVLALYKEWTTRKSNHQQKGALTEALAVQFDTDALAKKINDHQKQITTLRKAKEDATSQIAEKAELDKQLVALKQQAKDKEAEMNKAAGAIGNIVDPASTISATEDDNPTLRLYHPEGPNHKGMNMATGGLELADKTSGILSHHEVLLRIDGYDPERGAKIAGHRGFFLTNDGVDLNQALINYGLDFLRGKGYKKVMTPFMMRKNMMAKTAQLDQFDEELYNVSSSNPSNELC
jgi:seryl-tRNA synthetase